ncbi:site-specific integrase [Lederbergia citrea]|uniref:site-specific integrase n=1 Tax=Lederbergia citrea TaxID=2833581 RepID=UPI003211A417
MNLVQDFEQWLEEEGKAPSTIYSYIGDVEGFQYYLAEKAAVKKQSLSRFAFERYKQHLLDESFVTATINKKINSLKVFNDFLRMKGIVKDSYIHMKRARLMVASGSEHVVTALSEKEVEVLLFYLESPRKVRIRNKLIGLFTSKQEFE